MLKRTAAIFLVVLTLALTSCVSAVGGLKSYVDSLDGYQFLYPNGWVSVNVGTNLDAAFRDLIEETENGSVVITSVPEGKTLPDLGTPTEVGYKLSKTAIAPPDSGREAELINAESREVGGKIYYLLEYAVKLAGQQRHNFASIAISHNQLFTFNVSTTERRWEKLQNVFKQVVESFAVY